MTPQPTIHEVRAALRCCPDRPDLERPLLKRQRALRLSIKRDEKENEE